jgi:broad-specificity NMP kinase
MNQAYINVQPTFLVRGSLGASKHSMPGGFHMEISSYTSERKSIYLISGPLGVGKSTTSKELARIVQQSVLISGDHLLHMLKEEAPWAERLSITWINILALTRNFIQHGYHVIIDFVVEGELEWFCRQALDLNAGVKYVVLRADKEIITERLHKRGDPESLERSLFLLNQMEKTPFNKPFMYDTAHKQPEEIAVDIVNDPRTLTYC